jgi:hypothetical protein
MCVLQKLAIPGAFLVTSLVTTTAISTAAVVPIFTLDSDTIMAGDKGVLHLHLDLQPDSNMYYDAQFAGGLLTLYSGNGAFTNFQLGAGGTTRDFTYAFDYPTPGSFTPSFMLTGSFTQKDNEYVYLYDYPKTVAVRYGTCLTCVRYTTQLVSVFGWETFSDTQTFSFDGSLSLTTDPVVTPLPASLPLYASALGLIGLLVWGKRRKAARAA